MKFWCLTCFRSLLCTKTHWHIIFVILQKDYEELAISVMSIVDCLVHKTKVLFSLSLSLSLINEILFDFPVCFSYITLFSLLPLPFFPLPSSSLIIFTPYLSPAGKNRVIHWCSQGDTKTSGWWSGRGSLAS